MEKETKYPEIGKIYKHYKGGKYEVITLAKHSETNEDLVIYKSIGFGTVYARPLKMWFQTVEKAQAMKLEVIRFVLCESV